MTLMEQRLVPAPQTTPYAPAWMLYMYDDRAYFTYNGRLAATATCATAAQAARIEGIFQRLANPTSTRSNSP